MAEYAIMFETHNGNSRRIVSDYRPVEGGIVIEKPFNDIIAQTFIPYSRIWKIVANDDESFRTESGEEKLHSLIHKQRRR